MPNPIDQFFSSSQAALGLRARRSEVLASNIANADTPNYKARDFDFVASLRAAMGAGSGPLAMSTTSALHLAGAHGKGGAGSVNMQYRTPVQASIDGNTVELDTELGLFSDNAVRYQADLTFLSNQMKGLQSAIAP